MGAGCVHCAGLAKITLDEAIAIFEAADLLPIGEYKNSKTPWKAQCKKCKRVVTPSVYYVKSNGNGCKYCSNRIAGIKRRKPEHEAVALFSSKGLKPLVPYPGINKPWHSIHERCGRETYPRLSDIKAGEGGCKYCAGKVVDEESAIKTMQDAGFYPLEPYKSNKSYWRCIHLSCGNEVRTKFNTVQQGKGGCSFCSPTAKIPENEAVKFFELNGLRPLEPYVSSAKPWLSIHLACGNKVSPSWNSIRKGGSGCIYCAGNAPIGEKVAREIFFSKGLFPIDKYVNARTPWLSLHQPCGKRVSPTVTALRGGGSGCLYCGGAIIDAEDAIQIMKKSGYEPLEAYPGADKKWRALHIPCGNVVQPRLTNVKRKEAGCRYCSGTVPITEEEARELFLSKGFVPQEPFKGTHYPWVSIHGMCGKQISPRYKAVRAGLAGCKYCSGNKVDSEDAVALMNSKGFKPLEPFLNTHTPWKSIHVECGKEVSPRYADIAHNNGGCKYCTVKGFDLNKPADLYLITNSLLGAHKIGIAGVKTRRLEVHKREGWDIYKIQRFELGEQAYEIEQKLISWLREDLFLPAYLSPELMPQGGWTETVDADEIELIDIWRQVSLLVKAQISP
jgi:hypothetical protein